MASVKTVVGRLFSAGSWRQMRGIKFSYRFHGKCILFIHSSFNVDILCTHLCVWLSICQVCSHIECRQIDYFVEENIGNTDEHFCWTVTNLMWCCSASVESLNAAWLKNQQVITWL
jgi:hypothetical protein